MNKIRQMGTADEETIMWLMLIAAFAFQDAEEPVPENVRTWISRLDKKRMEAIDTLAKEIGETKERGRNAGTPVELKAIKQELKLQQEELRDKQNGVLDPFAFIMPLVPQVGDIGYLREVRFVKAHTDKSFVAEITEQTVNYEANPKGGLRVRNVQLDKGYFVVKGFDSSGMTTERPTSIQDIFEATGVVEVGGKRLAILEKFDHKKYADLMSPKSKDEPKQKKPVVPPPKLTDEESATRKLQHARDLLSVNESAAKRRLKEIVEKYPNTEAAKKASKLLK